MCTFSLYFIVFFFLVWIIYEFSSKIYMFQVGCRLIQLLMETAYIQPPVDQLEDGAPDIRPAFVHTLKTVETQ